MGVQGALKMPTTPWWTYLKQHVCVLCTGPESTDRAAVGVALDRRGMLHNALRLSAKYIRRLSKNSELACN